LVLIPGAVRTCITDAIGPCAAEYESRSGNGLAVTLQATRVDALVVVAVAALAAAVAVPRQQDLARDTRRAQVVALARSAGSAATLAHSQWQAGGKPATLRGTRGLVAMINGYPSAATLPLLLAEPEAAGFAHDAGEFRHSGAAGSCGVRYLPPASAGTAPRIVSNLEGC
jgi:type II secretory pathway pseudopilin PulG